MGTVLDSRTSGYSLFCESCPYLHLVPEPAFVLVHHLLHAYGSAYAYKIYTQQRNLLTEITNFSLVLTVIYYCKGHTHRWRQFHVSRLVFLFSRTHNPSINHLNSYCIKQIDYIFPSVCTVIDHNNNNEIM